MRKIAVYIGSRANYSSIKAVMVEIDRHPKLQLQVIAGASALLERFGSVVKLVEKDGFHVDWISHNIVEGETPITMAKSTGLGLIEMAMILDNLKPDFALVVGDRFEMMGFALAASYCNIPIAHTMGGEVSGSVDESIRHAITKFAHLHFPANEDARERIIKMGEDPKCVFNVGCPRINLVREVLETEDSYKQIAALIPSYGGVGGEFEVVKEPFLLVSQHSVTTEFGLNERHINETLTALQKLQMKTIMLWPNIDAGSDEISKAIRIFRERHRPGWLHLFKNLPINKYIHLMNTTACLVGNSSSGIREGAFIGTPVVNIGSRQNRRLCGKNVVHCGYDATEILSSIESQLEHGKYPRENLYGDGSAGQKVAEILSTIEVNIQKRIRY